MGEAADLLAGDAQQEVSAEEQARMEEMYRKRREELAEGTGDMD